MNYIIINRRLRFLLLAIALSVAFVTTSIAQKVDLEMLKKSTPVQRATWENTIVKKEMKISDAQYHLVSTLNLEYAKRLQPVIDSKDSWMEKGKHFMALYKEKDHKLQAIYTKEQYAQYQQVLRDRIAAARTAFKNNKPMEL